MRFDTFEEYIESNSSEKIVLAHVHASKRLYNFQSDSGKYSRSTPYFVAKVSKGTTPLTRVDSASQVTDDTKFHYDVSLSKLTLFSFDQENDEVIVEYRLFLSNVPLNLPWNLEDDASDQVAYEPRIVSVPKFKSQMSQGKKGINLTGSGDLKIENTDGFYDSIYDTLFFENKTTNIYSFNRHLKPSQAQILFRGIITSKDFSTKDIKFGLNDSIYALDELIPTETYGSSVIEDDADNHKRVIYGRAKNLKVQSLDKYGSEGTPLSGTISGVAETESIIGQGTKFLSELSEDDTILFDNVEINVEEVRADDVVKVSELERTFSNKTATVKPDREYSVKNREFQVSGHALRKLSTTITKINSRNRIILDDVSGFEAGDIIDFDGEEKEVRRISGDTMVLNTNFNLPHSVGATVSKKDLFNVRYAEEENEIPPDDITISNTVSGTTFTIKEQAEVNTAKITTSSKSVKWLNGYAGAWLGSPDISEMIINTGSMWGKYFILYNVDGDTTAYWFKDTVPVGASNVEEPDHGADDSFPIELANENPTAAVLTEAVRKGIAKHQENYRVTKSGTTITLVSTNPENITQPNSGTTAFTVTKFVSGLENNQKIDLTETLKPRDYLLAPDGNLHEILQVFPKSFVLRTPFGGSSETIKLKYKKIEYINDDSVVFVDCFGKTKDGTKDGELIRTGSEVVKDVLESVNLGEFLDVDSFTDSSLRAPQTMSLVVPEDLTSSPDSAKKVINKVNKSVLGSLFVNRDLNLGYDILDSEVPINSLRTITDSDVISWKVKDDGYDLGAKTEGKYRFIDFNPEENGQEFSRANYTSEFVNKYIGNKNTIETDLYLHDDDEAQEMVERSVFVNSLSASSIEIKGSLVLSKFQLGERVLLDLDRLYVALGSASETKRVGIVTFVQNTGDSVTLKLEDIGSIYTRAARITDNSAPEYSIADPERRVTDSYIVDDNEIIDGNEETFSTNLIG